MKGVLCEKVGVKDRSRTGEALIVKCNPARQILPVPVQRLPVFCQDKLDLPSTLFSSSAAKLAFDAVFNILGHSRTRTCLLSSAPNASCQSCDMIGLLKNAGALGVGVCCFGKVQSETKTKKAHKNPKRGNSRRKQG